MQTLSLYLAAARALLEMNVRSVAAALRVSDRTITQIEKTADPTDPRVQRLLTFYEDLGIVFLRDGETISGISLSKELRKLRFSFSSQRDPNARIRELQHVLRHIRGIVFNTATLDKTTASGIDTIDLHFPIETRDMVVGLISKWLGTAPGFTNIDNEGKATQVTPENLRAIIYGDTSEDR